MNDEHAGKGGLYVEDPKTGQRKLIERTESAERPPEASQPPVNETQAAEPVEET